MMLVARSIEPDRAGEFFGRMLKVIIGSLVSAGIYATGQA
jgi:hypothetical protein